MEKKKLYVLTGFLGSGKTTLLTHILKEFENVKIGIIQNEFGKLGIDGDILRKDGIEMTEINRGSIFCSCLKLSFVEALAGMGKKDLEYVFVESSGLADPSNIQEILDAAKVLADEEQYELKGVICLIDAVNFIDQLEDEETVNRQLSHCHLAAINKIDLVDEGKLEDVKTAVRSVNPICLLTTCTNGEIDVNLLKEDLIALQWKESEESINMVDNKPKTISLESLEKVSESKLLAFLNETLVDTYRIKGFMELEEGWKQIDVVEKLIDIKDTNKHESSELVFLSKVGPKVIKTVSNAWNKHVSTPMKLKN